MTTPITAAHTPLKSRLNLPDLKVSSRVLKQHFDHQHRLRLDPIPNPHQLNETPTRPLKQAAVLIPIIRDQGPLRIIITKRSQRLRKHPGQNAFPGGRRDPDDASLLATALRETEEEIGLTANQIEVLGQLGRYQSASGYDITPFVGFVNTPFKLSLNPAEVQTTGEIPLQYVLQNNSYERRRRGPNEWYYCLEYNQHYISGPTVAMMLGFYQELTVNMPAANISG